MQTKETQLSTNIFAAFLVWYFGRASLFIVHIWANFLLGNLHYFSIWLLLKTLISPWHKYKTSYGRGFDFKRFMEAWSFNMVARVIGFIIRGTTIIIGLTVEVFIFCAGFLFLAFWMSAPLVLAAAFFYGFLLLI
ncbi:MAG: hypothetical protein COT91_03325 [Candidatus Doudnabacteria bacterium CG10_big_fil_rev_8_21_14_0_10_41_10]|uniref:Uncharacterized protein n=1 Tax=Candidatus Doudnabacteria bacterium CG10_big_fil_rev_8_21_14_0_10_41_10 TaxID=1974551 RepID=A0A2H0VDD7_9BACT|nr:MAG: hypothetical protein COT91_03325 [Candidatus Doudnabacteria bacterium CG10_big_fil_rev_8_21_14_0_10_41_10]